MAKSADCTPGSVIIMQIVFFVAREICQSVNLLVSTSSSVEKGNGINVYPKFVPACLYIHCEEFYTYKSLFGVFKKLAIRSLKGGKTLTLLNRKETVLKY